MRSSHLQGDSECGCVFQQQILLSCLFRVVTQVCFVSCCGVYLRNCLFYFEIPVCVSLILFVSVGCVCVSEFW